MTTDKREAEIRRFLADCEAVGFDSDPVPKLVRTCRELLDQLATLRQSLSDALAIAQDWERQSRAAADSLLLVGMERDSLRQSLSAAEATIAAQADLAEKRRDEIEAAEARVGEMREALKPFAAIEARYRDVPGEVTHDDVQLWQDPNAWKDAEQMFKELTVGDLRRAARASD